MNFQPSLRNNTRMPKWFQLVGRGNPDLDKIAELKPDLILMTGEQEDLYDELSEIAPTVGYQINTDENWDYHETSLKVAEIFDKRDEMKKDLDRLDG